MFRMFFSTLLLLAGMALVASFGGRFHAAGDTLAVARPVAVLVVGILSAAALLLRPRRIGLAGLSLAAFGTASLVPQAPVSALPDEATVFALYQKNLLFRLPDTGPVAADILETGTDFVTLQELHIRNRPILDALRGTYPHQLFCPFAAVGGIAVLSRWPIVEGRTVCGDDSGLAAMQVATPDGPLWVVSLHLHWPFPYRQQEQVTALLPVLETFEAPVAIGGDFNMVPWSHAVGAISEATGSKLSGYAGGTFAFSHDGTDRTLAAWLPRLPIDHVLVPEGGAALSLQRRERLGSDHHGLVAEFAVDGRF